LCAGAFEEVSLENPQTIFPHLGKQDLIN